MTRKVSGTFEVNLAPLPITDDGNGVLARLGIEKRFHGGLAATSRGEMLSASTAVPGSAGYVAIEKVTGRLEGREGSFVLQHHGFLRRGQPQLSVVVVPDSGTGELEGLEGTLTIEIGPGGHAYVLEYSLPEKR